MQYPEPILEAFKAHATRALRRSKLLAINVKPWVRHGRTVYLWKEKDVAKAVRMCCWDKVMICSGWMTMSDRAGTTPSLTVGLLPCGATFAKVRTKLSK